MNRTYALMSLPYPVMLTESGSRTEAIGAAILTETTSTDVLFGSQRIVLMCWHLISAAVAVGAYHAVFQA